MAQWRRTRSRRTPANSDDSANREQVVYDLDAWGDPQVALSEWGAGSGASAATVFPPDGRTAVPDTTQPGWRAIVYLRMYDGDAFVGSCSGSMLSDNVVLTAAHCLYSRTSS